jgi:Secretion system C-terminal sorting domain/Lamin Tail Domain
LSKRRNELIQLNQPLNLLSLEAFIDQIVSTMSEGLARDYTRWNIAKNHPQQIDDIKSFLNERIAWMTTNLGSFSACNDVYIPPLVITRINYHPATTVEFPVSDDLEFIEISNNGDQVINLTGIYFRGTGLVFQFPYNSTLEPHSSLFLASNLTTFLARYGLSAFGQFTRHLSNKDQNLVLADGFGNVIDSVHYYDDPPWPDADSTGYYLQLADKNLDNNVAVNWTASDDALVSNGYYYTGRNLRLYPNPVSDILIIEADTEIKSFSIFDIQGRLLETIHVNSDKYEFDIRHYMKGTYIISVINSDKVYSGLIVKE